VLGRMFDALEYRGASQSGVGTLAKYAGIPVYNGYTDEYHPTPMLADVMTMREHRASKSKILWQRRHEPSRPCSFVRRNASSLVEDAIERPYAAS